MTGMIYTRRHALGMVGAALLAPVVPQSASAGDMPIGSVRDKVVAMVEKAAAAVSEHGLARALNRTESAMWNRPDLGLYVFVLDPDGNLLLHPDRRGEGRNVIASHDTQGTPFIRNMINAATDANGAGVWTRYRWTDARNGEPGIKYTYSKAVSGFIVSVGYVAATS